MIVSKPTITATVSAFVSSTDNAGNTMTSQSYDLEISGLNYAFSISTSIVAYDTTVYNIGDSADIESVSALTLNSASLYSGIPDSDWSSDAPDVSYITNTSTESTLNLSITPVVDTRIFDSLTVSGGTEIQGLAVMTWHNAWPYRPR